MSDQYTPSTGHVRHVATERFAHRITGLEFDTWLASVKAEAWDEGAAKAWGHGIENYLTPGFIPYSIRRQNPYREQETADESVQEA